MIDIHAHVLPGLDDGPANMSDALKLAQAAVDDRITSIVASPHMLDGIYNVSRSDAFAALAPFNDALLEHGMHVTVLAGADVHAETEIPQLLRRGELITVADRGKHLMIELPADVVPSSLGQLLFSIQLQNVTPIVSHPERNRRVQDDPSVLIPLVQAGCLTQVTAASILGDFGHTVADCAKTLFDYQLVHFVATDMHGLKRRPPRLSPAAAMVHELVGAETAREILEENPEAVIHGRQVLAPEPVTPRRRKRWFFW
jgi:protein-tyrosine phosphatase